MTSYYGQTIKCQCGRTHVIEPQTVICETNALNKIIEICTPLSRNKKVAVIFDVRTKQVAGQDIINLFNSHNWQTTKVLIPDTTDKKSPICNTENYNLVKNATTADTELIVSVGSGVINDLGKWVAYDKNIPYVVFATAASMNGYSSANIAVLIDGIKTVKSGKPPVAILTDPKILSDAPYIMTTAGLGDIVAKSVSTADWILNHYLFDDYFCDRSAELIANIEPLYSKNSKKLLNRDPNALADLFEGLSLTGVAMTMAGNSAPASGGEHLISHSIDMISNRDKKQHDLHGRQVGIGTIIASELYKRILNKKNLSISEMQITVDNNYWGTLTPIIKNQYEKKINRTLSAQEKLKNEHLWESIKNKINTVYRPPELIQTILKDANGAYKANHIGITKIFLTDILLHAHEMRSRFTVLDLAWMTGILPNSAEEIVNKWA